MSRKFLVSIDHNNLPSQNFKLQNAAGGIASPAAGSAYFDTSAGKPMFHNGTAFLDLTARTNHTGTQLASTISNFDTQVRTNRLDQMAAPTAPVSFNGQSLTNTGTINIQGSGFLNISNNGGILLGLNAGLSLTDAGTINLGSGTGAITLNATGGMNANGGKITNLQAPTAANDAARLVDVQSAAAGIDSKPSVRVVAITNVVIASAGLAVIDGVTLVAGDRVLLKGQTAPAENGVYVAAAGAWSRAADADATGEITPGSFWFVEEGTTYGATQWRCGNTGTITLGTTGITIQQFGASSMYSASNGVMLTGSNFTGVVEADKGLSVGASGFAIVADTASNITVTASGVGVSLSATGGLIHNAGSGIKVNTATASGTGLSGNVVAVVADANSSIELTASGVGVKLQTNGGLVHNGTGGVAVQTGQNAGTHKIGNTICVYHDPNGGTQNTVNGSGIKLNTNSGLTLTAGGLAVDSTVAVKKYAANIGDGSATSIAVTHSLGTKDVTISVRDAATDAAVDCDWVATSTTVTTLTFATAPASNSLRVVVHG